MKKVIVALLCFCFFSTLSAEHATGKKINGKIVDASGKAVKDDLTKKKYLVFYFTASW